MKRPTKPDRRTCWAAWAFRGPSGEVCSGQSAAPVCKELSWRPLPPNGLTQRDDQWPSTSTSLPIVLRRIWFCRRESTVRPAASSGRFRICLSVRLLLLGPEQGPRSDRKSVVEGKVGSVRVSLGCRRHLKKKKKK